MQPLKFISLLFCRLWIIAIGKKERDKLDRAQRRAAKIVLKTTDADAEKNLKQRPLSMRRDMHTINLIFQCLQRSPPMFFKGFLKVSREQSTTREVGRTCCSTKSELRRD